MIEELPESGSEELSDTSGWDVTTLSTTITVDSGTSVVITVSTPWSFLVVYDDVLFGMTEVIDVTYVVSFEDFWESAFEVASSELLGVDLTVEVGASVIEFLKMSQ